MRGMPDTTGAQEVVHCQGMPNDHWSSRGDDRGRVSTSFVEDSPGL